MRLDPSIDGVLSDLVGQRYRVRALLGHGGTARVYRVYDETTAREVALKQWAGQALSGALSNHAAREREPSIAQFEYEYRTLAQLRHPRMIEVYDYGLSERGPYFTMELLEGGDLRDRTPMSWLDACRAFYDICSSLALLHSRRLIHRDVSPRNIRCTRRGEAKLIDFGAIHPMGLCPQVVGTPAFAAPEVVQRLPLDGRVDLYSIGATLYFALTGKRHSAARDFSDVLSLSQAKPALPSRLVPGIPAALDSLVLSLLDPDPALRPRSAFEVMQRLASIARLENREPMSVARAYLAAPELVGREHVLARLEDHCTRATQGEGGVVIVEAASGMGRTRVLDECALWAKTRGCAVLRARGEALSSLGSPERELGRELIAQLSAALPVEQLRALRAESSEIAELFAHQPPREDTAVLLHARHIEGMREAGELHGDAAPPEQPSDALTRSSEAPPACGPQSTLVRCLRSAARLTPLVITVDDAHACDADSLALIAELAFEARDYPVLLLITREPRAARVGVVTTPASAATGADTADQALRYSVLEAAEHLPLEPLSPAQTHALLRSIFGDVPNIALWSDRIHAVTAGNPGEALDIAEWCVQRNSVRYESGSWALPSTLEVSDFPSSAADTLRERLALLSPLARELANAHAVALRHDLTLDDYRALSSSPTPSRVDLAVRELVRQRIVSEERGAHTMRHGAWRRLLRESLDEPTLRELHQALARYCVRTKQPTLHLVHHLLSAGAEHTALDQVLAVLHGFGDSLDLEIFTKLHTPPAQTAAILLRCLEAARAQGRPAHQEHLLRRWLTMLSIVTHDEYYFAAAPGWREQLERDAGLAYLGGQRGQPPAKPTRESVRAALRQLTTASAEASETHRVYSPRVALRHLVTYVGASLAIAARRLDTTLTDSLPDLLEPFAGLSPEVHAMWQLALGAQQALCRCQVEQARARWLEVYRRLEKMPEGALRHRTIIRGAIAYVVGASEASLGMQSAMRWASELDRDPLQAVSAMYLRRIVRLQLGDFDGAENFRRKAELLSVHADATQMFTSTIVLELVAHAISGQLLGIKQLAERIAPLAERCTTWEPYRALAMGYFERLRGDPTAALAEFERCLSLCAPSSSGHFTYAWPLATAGLSEAHFDLGDYARAADIARAGLTRCRANGVLCLSHCLVRALALAEAKLGHHSHGAELLDSIIETGRTRAITGLQLGYVYEARAFVAIEANDNRAIERYARLAAREYRSGFGSALGARCERLLEAAGQREPQLPDTWAAWGAAAPAHGQAKRRVNIGTVVSRAMAGAARAEGRALRALRLLCENYGASAGHLLLAQGQEPKQALQVSASYRVEPPDPALLPLAQARLQANLRQSDEVTRVRGDTNVRFERDANVLWTDSEGHAFEAKLLHCVHDGKTRYAGLVLLVQAAGSGPSVRFAQFANAVSAYLIDSGETAGL